MRHPTWSVAPLAVLAAGCACMSTEMTAPMELRAAAASPACRQTWPAEARATASPLLAAGGGAPGSGYVGLGVQGLFPSDSALSSGFAIDLNYTANLSERFSVELALGRAGYDFEGASGADLSAVTLGAVAQAGMTFGAGRWYAGGGLAYWMNDLSGATVEADDSVAWIVAAGADLPIATNGNLCTELRYILAEADLSVGDPLDLDAFGVRANYVFKY